MFTFCFVEERVVFSKEFSILANSEKRHLAYTISQVKDNMFHHMAPLKESK